MSRNVRVLDCAPHDVFRVLADGWLYPSWVVGASRMRAVEERWPEEGGRLHHSFGVWPALLDDTTVSEVWDPPHRAVMRAKGWPIGEARVAIDVKARGAGCVVLIQEEAVAGPGRLVPRVILDLMLHCRNSETLHRLAYLAEGMRSVDAGATSATREIADASADATAKVEEVPA